MATIWEWMMVNKLWEVKLYCVYVYLCCCGSNCWIGVELGLITILLTLKQLRLTWH